MTLRYSLLDEPLISARLAADGSRIHLSLPALFIALADDRIRDFPALRPHQRHPWHAFLVQLAAMALHQAGQALPFRDEAAWNAALLALTPDDPDGAAWCLVTPIKRPAFLQAPVPEKSLDDWEDDTPTPDSLDILVTSKNHDLKQQRIGAASPDDWVFALVSLQTAAPYPGKFNYGVCRMNKGSSSRPGLGVQPIGGPGRRWLRDLEIALKERTQIIQRIGYAGSHCSRLVWLEPWDGKSGKAFSDLDPFFIEISRRVRLIQGANAIRARRTGSKTARVAKVEADAREGNTGDLWTPVESAAGKSLSVSNNGFDYKKIVDLLFSQKYRKAPAQEIQANDDVSGLRIVAQAIAGGQSKTHGYHERRVPFSKTMRRILIRREAGELGRLERIAAERVSGVDAMTNLLRASIVVLFDNGKKRKNPKEIPESIKQKAKQFARVFEQHEDARFFDGPLGLNEEVESEHPENIRLSWYLDMAKRAEAILIAAFESGPRSGEQRYRARAAALSRLHGGLRSEKTLPTLAQHYETLKDTKETTHVQP